MTLTVTDTEQECFVLFFLENYLSIGHLLADMMETDCLAHTFQSIGQYSGHVFHEQSSHC